MGSLWWLQNHWFQKLHTDSQRHQYFLNRGACPISRAFWWMQWSCSPGEVGACLCLEAEDLINSAFQIHSWDRPVSSEIVHHWTCLQPHTCRWGWGLCSPSYAVQVNSEQVGLESLVEAGEWLGRPDVSRELIPPQGNGPCRCCDCICVFVTVLQLWWWGFRRRRRGWRVGRPGKRRRGTKASSYLTRVHETLCLK